MKQIIITIIALVIASSTIAQQPQEYFITGNQYLKYLNCSFECDFKSTDKVISSSLDTCKYQYNHLSSTFRSDSTYSIDLSILQKNDSSIIRNHYIFSGKYQFDNDNNICLIGESPFEGNTIKIREKKSEYNDSPCIYLIGYEFKLNNKFSPTYKKKLHTYCDGEPSFCKEWED